MLKNTHPLRKKIFKYLIIGSNGLLGSELKKILPRKETICVARKNSNININLLNLAKVDSIFKKNKFINVINAAATTDLVKCQKNKILCNKINLKLVLKLNELSKKYKFKLIHISTDQIYTYSNKKKHSENERIGYLNYYSKTKYLCEIKLNDNLNKLIIRTNFTGFKKKLSSTFIGWLFENISKKKTINLYNDLECSTIDVKTCAQLIKKLILKNSKGIFNIGTRDSLTKKEFAILFAKKLKKRIFFNELSANDVNFRRPLNLALNINKIEKILDIKMISSLQTINNLVKYKRYK